MAAVFEGMRFVQGGTTRMGSERFYPEEAPVREVRVDGFWIDETPVTNAQFRAFVQATGYRTCAETAPDSARYPGLPPELARVGSLLFVPPDPLAGGSWWQYVAGADWRHPYGPDSGLEWLDDHPVVHVGYEDAVAYATWLGKSLPTEAEWEFAARGGHDGREYAWGHAFDEAGRHWANTWQGEFPWQNLALDGYERTSPVRAYPPNGYGLHDMIGNVWEWTDDWYTEPASSPRKSCCIPRNPRGGSEQESVEPGAALAVGRKVIKGGSHLCAPDYCQRYRPAARQPQAIDTTTSHVGFRCVIRASDIT